MKDIALVIRMVVWSVYKTVARLVTGLCELQRIVGAETHTAAMTVAFEQSLRYSRSLAPLWIKRNEPTEPEDFETHIFKVKGSTKWNRESMRRCVTDITAASRTVVIAEQRRKIAYDNENPNHEKLLLGLWGALRPTEALIGRRSTQWQSIGFQGLDPATDFRGMGLIGLNQLFYFASQHQRKAHAVLDASLDLKYGYSFCIVGINITGYIMKLLKSGDLNPFLYAQFRGRTLPSQDDELLRALNVAYVQLFEAFGRFWLASKPKNMMAFGQVFGEFGDKVEAQLSDTERWAKTNSFHISGHSHDAQ